MNFSTRELYQIERIKSNNLENIEKKDFRNLILKLDSSINMNTSKTNQLEETIIKKDIEFEKMYNQKTIITCISIFLIFFCIITFLIGFFIGNRKSK